MGMLTRSLILNSFAVLSLVACAPVSGDTETDAGESSTADPTEATTTGPSEPNTGSSSDTTGEPQFPGCPVADPAIVVEVGVEGSIITERSEFELECAVQSVADGEIALQCEEGDVSHDIKVKFSIPTAKTGVLAGHDKVRLRYRQASQLGLEDRLHVSLHGLDDGALLLFYANGHDMFAAEFEPFWAPLQIFQAPVELCPAEGECDKIERSALGVDDGMTQHQIGDHGVASFAPGLWFYVEAALEIEPNASGECPSDALGGRRVEVLALAADL